ncbi:MAG: hypothetical protein KF749_12100 [Bacteroidetes bacterium]|nr:hypothetical protein [Bacteroidota bacterium]MCW5894247.1 hypothetical protein [Bacteroidota bacterium]
MRASLVVLLLAVASTTLIAVGCTPAEQQPTPGQLQVTFPLSTRQILPDTTIRKEVKGIGLLLVVVENGHLNIKAGGQLPPTIGWGIYSSRSGNMRRSNLETPERHRTFTFASNTVAVGGPPVLQVQNEDGLPHIRWVEVANFAEGGDTTGVYVGIPTE